MKNYILIIILLAMPFVSANVPVSYPAFEGKITFDGSFVPSSNSISDFNAIGFICNSEKCSPSEKFFEGTSSGNSLVVNYPSDLQEGKFYGLFFYKEGYITWEQTSDWEGNTNAVQQGSSIYLSKKDGCSAPLSELIVDSEGRENIPAKINVSVSIDTKTHSALRHSGPLDFVPDEIKDFYKVNTKINLKVSNAVNNEVVHEDSEDVTIDFSNSAFVHFDWTPEEKGSYILSLRSDVVDDKCLSSIKQEINSSIRVLDTEPVDRCYTLINSFSRDKEFPEKGEDINFSFEKISNFANSNGVLFPVKTLANLTLFRNGATFLRIGKILPANSNVQDFTLHDFLVKNFPSGNYTAHLRAVGEDPRCVGRDNIAVVKTMGFMVVSNVTDGNATDGEDDNDNGNANNQTDDNGNDDNGDDDNDNNETRDRIKPRVEIISPENKTYTNESILIKINASDKNLKSVWFLINNTRHNYTNAFFMVFKDGNYRLKAFADDKEGNIGSDEVLFLVNASIIKKDPVRDRKRPSRRIIGRDRSTKRCLWVCTQFSSCDASGKQHRECSLQGTSCVGGNSPDLTRSCRVTTNSSISNRVVIDSGVMRRAREVDENNNLAILFLILSVIGMAASGIFYVYKAGK